MLQTPGKVSTRQVHKESAVPDPNASELSIRSIRSTAVSPRQLMTMPDTSVEHSFEAVYRAHAKAVSRWAIRLLGPGGDFEDVVHDVFLVVRRKLPEFRGDAEITTWRYEITVRVVQDWRKRARWWSWATGRGHSPSRGQMHVESIPTPEPPLDPHDSLEAREREQFLYRVLNEMGEVYRTAFILFELEGLSGERIAEITGTRVGTVWARLSRARRQFLQRMRAWEAKEKHP
jgi:RNA polymerase sigma-70 factor (ECF subfamily)